MLIFQSRAPSLCRAGLRQAMIKHLLEFSQVFSEINDFMYWLCMIHACYHPPFLNLVQISLVD